MKKLLQLLSLLFLGSSLLPAGPLEDGFRAPPHDSGIRCFWWWLNGNVTKEAISRDLEEMKAKGFSGALIFDADGSGQRRNQTVPAGPVFGGPEWTALFVHACREAKRLDLELSLNLQSGWNLGGPKVTPEESSQHLVWSATEVVGGQAIDAVLPVPKHQDFYRDITVLALPMGAEGDPKPLINPIDKLNLKTSTQELGGSAPDCRFLLETSPAKKGEWHIPRDRIVVLGEEMDAEGRLQWQAPPGRWTLLRIGHEPTDAHVSTHSEGWGGRVLDYLNPDSLRAYWKRNLDPLFDAIGPLAGTTLKYVHTDSWEGGGMNWTPGFEKSFRECMGYECLPWLAVVAGYIVEDRESSNAFLADFRKTIGGLVGEHYGLLARLAAKRGMVTHPECSGPHAGPLDGLLNYGHSELMMSEFWSPSPHRPTPDRRFFCKQASSAAHTYGKTLVGAEGFTTIGRHWNDVPWQHMKPSFDTEFCAGMNLLFVHTFTCSPKEMGLPGQEYFAGTHFNPQITWWEQSPAVIDYFRRCQYLGQRSRFVADVLHYYGDHIPNVFGRKGHDPAGALPEFDYDVLSEELLLEALSVKDGKLCLPSGMEYRVLSLPDHGVLSLGALRKIRELVHSGATVIGPKPRHAASLVGGDQGERDFQTWSDELWGKSAGKAGSVRSLGKGRVVQGGITAGDFLLKDGVLPDLSLQVSGDPSAIDWIHYRIGEADVYFLAELSGKAQEISASFRVEGRLPELWDPVDGSIREAGWFFQGKGQTHLPGYQLRPHESLFFVFRQAVDRNRTMGPNHRLWRTLDAVKGPWQLQFDPKWGGPQQPVEFQTLSSWHEHPNPGIKAYSGATVYRTRFTLARESLHHRLALSLGRVEDIGIAQVKLNGVDLGVTWIPPFRVELGKAAKTGENELEVIVVNSWRNRVSTDFGLPQKERLTRTNVTKAGSQKQYPWKLEPAGLLGPVQLERYQSPR